jgi:hypothetical protein
MPTTKTHKRPTVSRKDKIILSDGLGVKVALYVGFTKVRGATEIVIAKLGFNRRGWASYMFASLESTTGFTVR